MSAGTLKVIYKNKFYGNTRNFLHYIFKKDEKMKDIKQRRDI